MFKRSLVVLLIAIVAFSMLMGNSEIKAQEPEVVIDFAVGHDLGYVYESGMRFAREVEYLSEGEIEVNVIESEAIGSPAEVMEQLELGELDINHSDVSGLIPWIPGIQATTMPFLIENHVIGWEMANDAEFLSFVREELLEASNDDLILLGMTENAFRHLYTTKGPIRVPEDLTEHGVKMRTMEVPMHVEIWDALGSPSILTIPAPERYSALETGMIDGTEGGLQSAWDAGLMEVNEYATLTGHMYDFHYYVMNNEWFEGLSAEHQEIIELAGDIAFATQKHFASTDALAALDLFEEAGIEVTVPTAEEIEKWAEIALPIAEEFLVEEVGEDWVEEAMAAAERAAERYRARKIK